MMIKRFPLSVPALALAGLLIFASGPALAAAGTKPEARDWCSSLWAMAFRSRSSALNLVIREPQNGILFRPPCPSSAVVATSFPSLSESRSL